MVNKLNLSLNKTVCVFNFAPHYREAIYKKMDKELSCDFYFGEDLGNGIKPMDVLSLKGFKGFLRNVDLKLFNFKWQLGIGKVFFAGYDTFVLTGDASILSNWLVLIYGKIFNKKVLLWSHGLRGNESRKVELLTIAFHRLAFKILLYGNYGKNKLINKGFSDTKLAVIYNSMDYELQKQIRETIVDTAIYRNKFNNEDPNILFVGRIQKGKKIELLLQAFIDLNKKGKFCNLTLIGDFIGSAKQEWQEKLEFENLESNIFFYGPCHDEKYLAPYFYYSDVCVSPGNVGLLALHAFAYGTPVITHNNFDNQMPEFEIIEAGRNGDFFEEDNLYDLKIKMEKWLFEKKSDREKTRASAIKALEEKYTIEHQIKILESVSS